MVRLSPRIDGIEDSFMCLFMLDPTASRNHGTDRNQVSPTAEVERSGIRGILVNTVIGMQYAWALHI